MTARYHFTRWEGNRLVLSEIPHIPFRLTRPRRARWYEIAGAALVSLAWFFIALEIAIGLMGCASADGSDSSPESPSPEAQPDFLPRHWCCDAGGYLTCGMPERPSVGTCYCAGVVHGDTCEDQTAWTPGTFCTQALLVCFEEE